MQKEGGVNIDEDDDLPDSIANRIQEVLTSFESCNMNCEALFKKFESFHTDGGEGIQWWLNKELTMLHKRLDQAIATDIAGESLGSLEARIKMAQSLAHVADDRFENDFVFDTSQNIRRTVSYPGTSTICKSMRSASPESATSFWTLAAESENRFNSIVEKVITTTRKMIISKTNSMAIDQQICDQMNILSKLEMGETKQKFIKLMRLFEFTLDEEMRDQKVRVDALSKFQNNESLCTLADVHKFCNRLIGLTGIISMFQDLWVTRNMESHINKWVETCYTTTAETIYRNIDDALKYISFHEFKSALHLQDRISAALRTLGYSSRLVFYNGVKRYHIKEEFALLNGKIEEVLQGIVEKYRALAFKDYSRCPPKQVHEKLSEASTVSPIIVRTIEHLKEAIFTKFKADLTTANSTNQVSSSICHEARQSLRYVHTHRRDQATVE